MVSRKEIHDWDVKELGKDKHKPACLSGHVSWYAASNTCSYRGQAYLKAVAESGKSGKYIWQSKPEDTRGPKSPGDWNIGKPGNYQRRSGIPIWHEAHHIVTNAELNHALNSVGAEDDIDTKKKVRGGLLDEGYNLNDQLNMIILPMGKWESERLNLPRHRETYLWSHEAFSDYIKRRLDKFVQPMKEKAAQCQLKEYEKIRKKIEGVSEQMYPEILKAGPILLDDMPILKPAKEL
jgi:hypothetical protein